MEFLKILTLILFFSSVTARSAVVEGTFAASSAKYKESEESTWGISTRLRYRNFGAGTTTDGYFVMGDFPGYSPLLGHLSAGYGISTSGSSSYDLGIGVSYSTIWSLGAVVTIGQSFELGSGFYGSLPIIFYTNLGFQFTPFIGWKF